MSVAIQVNCLENHGDEVRLITERQNFKLIQRGKGPGRIEMRFKGSRPSMGLGNFVGTLQTTLRDKCLDPIEVTIVAVNDIGLNGLKEFPPVIRPGFSANGRLHSSK
jgi:hypothetical protein